MRGLRVFFVGAWVFCAVAGSAAPKARSGPVYVLRIEGTIREGLPHYVERGLEEAHRQGASLVVVRIRSFGGLVSAATAVKDALLEAQIPTVAYVDRRAISAGALVALACDRIVMAPGGSIGAATPYRGGAGGAPVVEEKMVSALRAIFRSTAEAKGHPAELAEAMVDPDVEIQDVVPKGKLLTLSSKRAYELRLADRIEADDASLLSAEGLGKRGRVEVEPSFAEHLADLLTDPMLAGILVSVGLWALFIALKAPGLGAPEVLVVLAFAAFLFGKHVAGLAGFEEIILVSVGVVLLALEIFVLPGTGIAGIAGLAALIAGILLSFANRGPSSPFFWSDLERGLRALGVGFLVSFALAVASAFVIRRTKAWKRFTLRQSSPSDGSSDAGQPERPDFTRLEGLVGKAATSATALNPEGEIEVEDRRYPARADKGYISPGTSVLVLRTQDGYVVVRAKA